MKNIYSKSKTNNKLCYYFLQIFFLLGIVFVTNAQLRVPFTQRTSQYTPTKKIYNVKGDFTMIGNTNLTLQDYGDETQNGNNRMKYVDIDASNLNGIGNTPTFNSSSSTLALSTENGAIPSCSNIVYAGLYWTGRTSNSDPSKNTFSVTKNNVTKNFDKRAILLKGPNASSYTQFTASSSDIYYPTTSDGYMYSAYKEVTDYVRTNGVGSYTAADIALVEGDGGGTGYYGGWSLIVVYENAKMKYRDVTIFDGHAYVTSGTASFEIPVSGFNTVQAGPVGMKLGIMAGEGDRDISGDKFQILKQSDNNFLELKHSGNSTGNFFNSSIQTGGNTRNPNLLNNTGLDISMFNIPNTNNSVITNRQTSTTFKYNSTQDTYIIFAIAMAVDAYVPEPEGLISITGINGNAVVAPYSALPGQEGTFKIDIKNLGTEAINNSKIIVPIPYASNFVTGSLQKNIYFTPNPTPNNLFFDPSLGASGSIVWDFGTLPMPANRNDILASLTFKLKVTTDCSILSNFTCGNVITVDGSISGVGATTGTVFIGKKVIQGYTSNGNCMGEPISEHLKITIDGSNYVTANCLNTPLTRNFYYCSDTNSVSPIEIASNFPTGSLFYDTFPVTSSSIQYTANNPFPLVNGSTITYYAIPPSSGASCNFPFTIAKCRKILANDDSGAAINGLTGGTSFSNVLINDTLNGVLVTPSQVSLSFVSSTNSGIKLNGSNVVVDPGTPAGTYTLTYQICEVGNLSNCDTAIVTVTVTKSDIIAQDDTIAGGNGVNGNPNVGNVLSNNGNGVDTLNGNPVAINQVNLTITTPASPINGGSVPVVDITTGEISIPEGTPAGEYSIVYQICEKLNITNCDSATVIITVTTPAILAVDNNYSLECSSSLTLGNVIENDLLNGLTFSSDKVNITLISGQNANINLDTTTGIVSIINNGLTVGQYILEYKICEKLNSSNCSTAKITITVEDTTAPSTPTLADVTSECSASVTAPTASDNCAGTITATTNDPLSYTSQGTYLINWTFDDGNGNTSVATQNVIIKDVTIDEIPTMKDVIGECSASVTAPTNTDNCAGTITATTNDPLLYTTQGTYVVNWTFDDGNGNKVTTTQNVIVKDITAPSVPILADVIAECSASVTPPTTSDNCAGTVTATTNDPLSYTAQGTYMITWTFNDGNDNTSVATQNVIIHNTTPTPTVACYQTATFNTTTCAYDITGTQPEAPVVACYQTATFNATTCAYDITGTQPEAPVVACYQTATFNPTTCAYDITGTQPEAPVVACYQTATFNPTTCAYDITGTQPEAPVVACYQTATFNPTTCAYDITGTQPEAPVVACYQTATFNPTTCAYDITGTQPEAPVVACYQTATFNATTCAYDITGTQPEAPVVACYQTATFNTTTCAYDITGTQPEAPVVACYQTATFNATTCAYDITGTQPEAPVVACYQTATFNPTTCAYDITGTQPEAPVVACYQTATFNPTTCAYDITGTQPEAPVVACYQTATFNPTTCAYDITGTQPEAPVVACYQTATFNPTTCAYDITGTQPEAPVVACYQTATFNPTTCAYDITGTQPEAPVVACYQTATFNPTTCAYDITGTQPEAPVVACYQTATFNTTTCAYDITGTQPEAPVVACYQTATFNATTCAYDITGTQPEAPVVACYQTATFNPTTCAYDITGTQPEAPVVACYQTATFNATTCAYDITGTQPEAPVVACYQTATFNTTTCAYDITGTQPEAPVVACYQTATFNATTCAYDITGTQPEAPVVACYQTATFNATTCAYDITGTQPEAPVVACYQTATFNPTTCAYDITGTQPEAPVVACYQTATFNTTTCAYDITGTQPEAPVVACYQTATFNATTCAYDITGTQPEAPVVACYQTATFNPTTCAYDITGTQPEAPVVACYQTATFNPTTCAYDITGTQPEAPVVACYQTATFNATTCAYDITGTQPEAPVVACYQTATFNTTTCAYDITGTQPEAPVVACYQTATFNTTTCAYDITGTQPEAPVVACYQTATFNATTCAYDITGTQPETPVVACYQTATFNATTCAYDITGTQPEAPVVACYQTATFNATTCAYDITGTQPEAPVVACYQTATFNPTTCAYDITGTQPEAPVVACYQTATFNATTCAYDITGTQPEAPVVACYQTATFNPTTCAYDITGTQPEAPVVACYQTATFNPTTCAYDITGTQPEAPVVACYQTATFNTTTCAYDITGTQPEAPVVACYQTATFNATTCAYDITGTQPEAPVVACYQTATFNTTTCAYDITGTQPEAPVVACYQTATFNATTCAYDITGTQPEAPVVACYQTATFNATTCAYDITGTQPEAPVVACYQTATFNPTTCAYDITGTQPEAPVVACYQTATFNTTTCAYDITGTQPEAPVVACYQTATFNTTTCAYDITGTQPEAPVVACYQTATFNATTCAYDITGTQPETPVVACYQTATFNATTCAYDITGTQPEAPVVACYQTATFNATTCAYDITGTQPEAPVVACYQTATFNATTCAYDITGTQPEAPVVACYQTATFNATTCAYDITGTQPEAPVVACYQTATFNATTCAYDITGTQPEAPVVACYQTATFNATTCAYDITGTQPLVPTLEDLTGQCSVTATAPTFTIECSGTVITATTTDPLTYTTQGTYVISWTFDDGNGFIQTATQNVIVKDTEKPAVPQLEDVIGQCSATATVPSALDNCSGNIKGTTNDPLTYSTKGTFVITWTFEDGNGNSAITTQNVIVKDDVAPIAPTAPKNGTYACLGDVPTAATLTANDNCDGEVNTKGEDAIVPGKCANSFVITRTWTFKDSSGNSSETITQTITVEDNLAPVFAELPATSTISCPAKPEFTQATALDNCGGEFTLTFEDVTTPGTNGSYSVTRTWKATDSCGNSSTAEQTINVEDKAAPVPPVLEDIKGQCSATATAPIAVDSCVGNVLGTTSDPLTYNTQGTFVIRWTFNDGNGNSFTANQNVIVDDTRAPLAPELADITGQCSATATPPTANDGCAGAIVGTTTDPLKYTLEGTYVIRWTFDDGNGNVITANQNVIVTSLNEETGTPGYAKCNDDVTLKINLKELLPQGTPEGGTWTDAINPNTIEGSTYIPNGVNKGFYDLKYVVADGDCSKSVKVRMEVDTKCIVKPECSPIQVYNAVTPNDDGVNDFFKIENIEFTDCFPTNKVEIYNRWGVLVYEVNQYDNNSRIFRGISEGRATVNKSAELPTGTYFYILEYTNDEGDTLKKDGYLYLTR